MSHREENRKTTTALAIATTALAIALALVLLAPHVAVLKPIAKRLGLIDTVNHTVVQVIYVPVNHTVYVNQTVLVPEPEPVYIYICNGTKTIDYTNYTNNTIIDPINNTTTTTQPTTHDNTTTTTTNNPPPSHTHKHKHPHGHEHGHRHKHE
jgi:hypothetical protein